MLQHRNFDDDRYIHTLHSIIDGVENARVCYCLKDGEFPEIVEDDLGQSLPIDLAVFDNLGPTLRYFIEGRAVGRQDFVPDAVSVNRVPAVLGEKRAHLALARCKTATEDPSLLLSVHGRGR